MKFKFFKSMAMISLAAILCLPAACGKVNSGNSGGGGKQIVLTVQSADPIKDTYNALLASEKEGTDLWKKARFTKDLVEGFKKIRPDVKIEWQEDGWGEALYEAQVRYVRDYEQRGTVTVDIMIGESYMGYWTQRGIFAELDSSKFADIIPGTYSDMVKDGKQYGVPLTTGLMGLQYNTQILTEVGIPEDKWVPTTWDELLENCKKVNEYAIQNNKDYRGIMLNNVSGMPSAFRAIPFMRQAGGEFMKNGEVTLNTPENIEAFTYLRELAKYAYGDGLTATDEEQLRLYFNTRNYSAYNIDGNFTMASAPEHIKSAKLPTSNDNVKGNILTGNVLFGIMKGSKNKEVAEEFLAYITSEEVQLNLYKYDGRLPVNSKTLSGEAVRELHPNINSYIDELLEGNVKGGFPYFSKNSNDIWSKWGRFYNNVLTGSDSIASLVSGIQGDIEENLK